MPSAITPPAATNRPTAAAASMVVAMIMIGFIDIYVARIAGTISVWQFLATRLFLALPLIWFLGRTGLGSLRPRKPGAVALRSLLTAAGMFCYFGALAFMPLAMALAGLFTSPVFVLLITAFVLRQPIGPWRVLAVAIGFAGILVVLGPSSGNLGWIVALPVLGGLLYAGGVIATRTLCEGESTLSLLLGVFLAQGVLGCLALAVVEVSGIGAGTGGMAFLTRGWVWPMWDALPFVALQAVGSVAGVALIIRAYQLGEASHVAVFEYSVMIFGPLFGWWLMGQKISAMQGFGIVLIACAGVIIALRGQDKRVASARP